MRNACHRLTRTDLADLRGVSHTGGAHSEPYEFGDLNRRQHQMVANSARGAASFVAATAVVRADWACYSAPFYGTFRRAKRPVLDHGEDGPEDRRGHRRHRLGVSGGLTVAGVGAAAAPVGLG